eukprot:scaffold25117_cov117-Cylindrotheca_fusiformis.AAC.1
MLLFSREDTGPLYSIEQKSGRSTESMDPVRRCACQTEKYKLGVEEIHFPTLRGELEVQDRVSPHPRLVLEVNKKLRQIP